MSSKEILIPCHTKKIPLWLVLLDNVPTLTLVILGIMIISRFSSLAAVFYGGYTHAFSLVGFVIIPSISNLLSKILVLPVNLSSTSYSQLGSDE